MDLLPHILAVPLYLPGHEIPLLHLCQHLVSSGGCRVSILQTSRSKNFEFGPSSPLSSPLLTIHTLPEDLIPSFKSVQDFLLMHQAFDQLGDTIAGQWKDRRLTAVITDVLVGWGKHVAEALSIPWTAFWTSTTTELAVYFNIPRLIPETCIKGTETFVSAVSIPGLPEIQASEYSTIESYQTPEFFLKPMLEGFVRKVRLTLHADRVLVNTAFALEGDAVESLKRSGVNVAPIGPLHLLSTNVGDDDDPTEVLPWLEQQRESSVLFIAFGTTVPLPFLWVVRPSELLKELPSDFSSIARFSLREDKENSPETRGESAARGLVTDWVPQRKVLSHRAVKAFFTHCGWNSVLESITSGLPMISRPFLADQVLTSKLLDEQWGVSVRIRGAGRNVVVKREEIEDALNELQIRGETLRARAGELGAEVKEAMQNEEIRGSSFANLDSFVKDLQRWSSK